ncbi:transporter substrate-binding domain-containing protein [Mycobacterium sp. NPDC003449]
MRRSRKGLAAVAVLALALTGCSSGDGAEPRASAEKVDELAALVPADIAAKGTIGLGVNVDIAPLKFIDDAGEVTGFSIEQFQLASEVLGLQVNVEQGSFDSLIPGLESGRYGALASLADIKDRQARVRFVDFLRAGVSWVASADADIEVGGRDDLCGHSVAVLKGSGAETEMHQQVQRCAATNAPELKLAAYPDSNAALLAVDSGEDELAMIDSPAATYNAAQFPDKYTVAFTEYTNPNGIGFPLEPPALADAYAAALKHLFDSGQYRELADKYQIPEGDLITDFPINKGPELAG